MFLVSRKMKAQDPKRMSCDSFGKGTSDSSGARLWKSNLVPAQLTSSQSYTMLLLGSFPGLDVDRQILDKRLSLSFPPKNNPCPASFLI